MVQPPFIFHLYKNFPMNIKADNTPLFWFLFRAFGSAFRADADLLNGSGIHYNFYFFYQYIQTL